MSIVAVTAEPELGLDPARLQAICRAVDRQNREFCEATGCEYTPVVYFSADVLAKLDGEELTAFVAGTRLLTIQRDLVASASVLGFHADVLGVIFARARFVDWDQLSVTVAHEVLEMTGDPTCSTYEPLGDGRHQAREFCDRVQGDTFLVEIETDVLVRLPNYLLPAAFVQGSPRPWDRLGRLTEWDGMTPGGFMIVRSEDGAETQIFARHEEGARYAQDSYDRPGSRVARRLGLEVAVAEAPAAKPKRRKG